MRQTIDQLQDIYGEKIEWYYGAYETNLPMVVPRANFSYIPSRFDASMTPTNFNDIKNLVKPNVLFMHDDPQRCLWMGDVDVPSIYWLPWDNEDPRITQLPLLDKVDRTVMVAKFAQKIAQNLGYECGQIYNPINTDVYHPDSEAGKRLKQRIGIPEDDQILLWVGRPGWRKRLMHTIEVAARVMKKNPKVHLMLHMDQHDPGLGYNIAEFLHAREVLGNKKVIIPGDLNFGQGYPQEVMNEIYNAADIYIATNGGEGMNLCAAEAMSCGKPIIMTDVTTTQEFAGYEQRGGEMIGPRGIGVKQALNFEDKGIVRPYVDINDFVAKTEMLLSDKDLQQRMGKAGRLFVQKEVDYRVVGAKWKEELDKFRLNMVSI